MSERDRRRRDSSGRNKATTVSMPRWLYTKCDNTPQPAPVLPPAITRDRRPLSNRTAHSQPLPPTAEPLTRPRDAPRRTREKLPEPAIYIPRHRRMQQQQQEGAQSKSRGSDSDGQETMTNGRPTAGSSKSSDGHNRDGNSRDVDDLQESVDKLTLDNGAAKPVDRRALILSFIENAGKDEVRRETQEDAQDDQTGTESESDDEGSATAPPAHSAPSSPMRSSGGRYGHVLEVHGFSSDLTTEELRALLDTHQPVDIKWVDDTHALAVFQSTTQAMEAYELRHRLPVQLRLYSDASAAAKRKYERTQPRAAASERDGRERPLTTAAVASRLVGGALGIRVPRTAEQIAADKAKMELEREKRRAQREAAEQAKRQAEAVWFD